jgi:hypothetical protein
VISGCAGGGQPPSGDGGSESSFTAEGIEKMRSSLEESGFTAQAEFLQDGVITAEEYQASFERLKSCITSMGYDVSEAVTSPLTGSTLEFVYMMNGRDPDVALVDFDACEAEHWQPLAGIYGATAPQRVEEPLRVAIVDCMKREGEDVDDSATTFTQIVGAEADDSRFEVAATCALDEAYSLYPELPGLGVFVQPML